MFTKLALVCNPHSDSAVGCARRAAAFLAERGIAAVPADQIDPRRPPDLVLTFGGDGTLLSGARIAMKCSAPLLGINLGTVGFLTEEEPDQLEAALTAVLEGRFSPEERGLLRVLNVRTGETFDAMNDAVITRGGYARLIQVNATVNGQAYGTFTADGMIVATPTGSTGYSLSAGGPIVAPDVHCLMITPVCAHSMTHVPCVVSESSVVRLVLNPQRQQTAELQVDGVSVGTLQAGDRVEVSGSEKKITLLRLRPADFFGLIRRKLIEWGS